MTVQANELNPTHVGAELSYGPGMMFHGTIARVEHSTSTWRGGRWGSREIPAPPRAFVAFADGRTVTLSHAAQVEVKERSRHG